MQIFVRKDKKKIRYSFDEAKSIKTNVFRTNDDKNNSYQVKILNMLANKKTITKRFLKQSFSLDLWHRVVWLFPKKQVSERFLMKTGEYLFRTSGNMVIVTTGENQGVYYLPGLKKNNICQFYIKTSIALYIFKIKLDFSEANSMRKVAL